LTYHRRTTVIDLESLEAESEALKQRSLELVELLDAGHPVLDRTQLRAVLVESKRLAGETHRARRDVAARVAAGLDPGCPIGRAPAIRRVKTDWRGRDEDPLGGRAVVTDALLEFWRYRRDVVFPAVEAMFRAACESTPYRLALVASARGHVALLQGRCTMQTEAGDLLEAALGTYDVAYANLRQSVVDATEIAAVAQERLDALRREVASLDLGDDTTTVTNFLANTVSMVTDSPVDPKTAMPLVPHNARTGQPVAKVAG
jgi:hypothetical protein